MVYLETVYNIIMDITPSSAIYKVVHYDFRVGPWVRWVLNPTGAELKDNNYRDANIVQILNIPHKRVESITFCFVINNAIILKYKMDRYYKTHLSKISIHTVTSSMCKNTYSISEITAD